MVDQISTYLLPAFILFNLSKLVGSIRLNRYFRSIGIKYQKLDAFKDFIIIGIFKNPFSFPHQGLWGKNGIIRIIMPFLKIRKNN